MSPYSIQPGLGWQFRSKKTATVDYVMQRALNNLQELCSSLTVATKSIYVGDNYLRPQDHANHHNQYFLKCSSKQKCIRPHIY